jgi:starch phosphorylase
MEIGIENEIPTYSGGLGILAGDAAFSFADLGKPAIYVTLLYKMGYASQKLDRSAGQLDFEAPWDYRKILTPLGTYVDVEIAGKVQKVGAWQYLISGKEEVPVLFLDTDVEGNDPATRGITDRLYSGDRWHRLMQEMVLGIGGYRMLQTLGRTVDVYHLNESHAALLIVELIREHQEVSEVKKRCVFTSHTPVSCGHDAFSLDMVKGAFAHYDWMNWEAETNAEGRIDLSRLAVKYSSVTNAVSLKHRYVSERILNHNNVEHVTNGVYHKRWIHAEVKKLFDEHIAGWEETPALLTRAMELPTKALEEAHLRAKSEMMDMVYRSTGRAFSKEHFTMGLAKRVTGYKRNDLILTDLDRLVAIAEKRGPIQVILAGKSHPSDDGGKAMLRGILHKIEELAMRTDKVRVAFLENYDISTAKLLVAGCDVWLNNPTPPLEACGTSGMKAAMNGVLNFSVYDGWWLEGGADQVNGWGIGKRAAWGDLREGADPDLEDMYGKLSESILATYYNDKDRWWTMAKNSIATVGPQFNSYRMINEYEAKVYSRVRSALIADQLLRELRVKRDTRLLRAVPISPVQV